MFPMHRTRIVRRRPLLRAAVVGGGAYMAGRAAGGHRRAERAGQQQPQPASGPDTTDPGLLGQLSELSAMHERGALTDDEFAAAKARVLG